MTLISAAKYLALAVLVTFITLQVIFVFVIAKLRSEDKTELSQYVVAKQRISWVVGGFMIVATGLLFFVLDLPDV